MAADIDWRTGDIDAHHARIVLDVAGRGFGSYASGSMRALALAAFTLDQSNLARLALGFPDMALAVYTYKNVADGLALLEHAAGGPS